MKTVEIITIGDELLIGQVVDTNSAWMAQELNKLGWEVARITSVGDWQPAMLQSFKQALKEHDVVLLTGGLGPTKDDITKQTLCQLFETELVFNPDVLNDIKTLFQGRNIPLNSLNRSQAMVPATATVVRNRWGTAPVCWFEQNGKILVSMPGVPYEMKGVMTAEILPRLQKIMAEKNTILHRTYCVKGYPESVLAEKLSGFETELPQYVRLAYLPTPGIIRLRLSGQHPHSHTLTAEMERLDQLLRKQLGNAIFADQDLPVAQVVANLLKQQNRTLATAESCSGGYLAHLLTAESGASLYFKGGVVAYSNEVKQSLLQVSNTTLETHGAVSRETVTEMLKGVQQQLKTTCAIATTGIAGPLGGTPEKPVGTVWIGVAVGQSIRVEQKQFGPIRENNIVRTAQTALLMLHEMLLVNTVPKQ